MTPDDIARAVHRYIELASAAEGADVAALYAEDATVEDPVGSTPHVGIAAIAAFYDSVRSPNRTIDLITLRVSGDTAAFHFRVVTAVDGRTITVEPIDVMSFDRRGRITSMRAIWAPEDLVVG
ncbi:nuclear transport factor 2 family protein [Rhodococcus sp. ACT016]|uniref:nuclear transport factor 2 family protein n=1 Tax=Rhodococcus sp. ACT016 TaxID=3134808 RepID=UPI003D276A13